MADCNSVSITEGSDDVIIRQVTEDVTIIEAPEQVVLKQVTEPVTIQESDETVIIQEGPRAYVYTGPSPNWQYEEIILTATNILNSNIHLANTPSDLESVELEVEGAPNLIYGNAFTITGSTLSWVGSDIEGILTVGDIVGIRYVIY